MRIAKVSLHTSPYAQLGAGDAGGLNVVVRHQAEALAALGHHVEILTRRSDAAAPKRQEMSPGVFLRQIDAGPPRPIAKSRTDHWIGDFREGMRELGPYDLIHSHHWMSGVAALPLARGWQIPHVQSYHSIAAPPGASLGEGEPAESPGRIVGEELVAMGSDLVLAISHAEARTVIERCGGDPARVSVLPPGVDTAMFHPLTEGETHTAPVTGPYLLFAARLQPLKGADLAIDALARLPRGQVKLVLAGDVSEDFPDYHRELERRVQESGLSDEVVYVGPQDRPEFAQTMRNATLLVVPSHSETFGLVALEAAASGVPVVASAAGGLREAVVDGESGVLLTNRDPNEWASAIAELLGNPSELRRMSVAARQRALDCTWSDVGARLAEIYEGLLSER